MTINTKFDLHQQVSTPRGVGEITSITAICNHDAHFVLYAVTHAGCSAAEAFGADDLAEIAPVSRQVALMSAKLSGKD